MTTDLETIQRERLEKAEQWMRIMSDTLTNLAYETCRQSDRLSGVADPQVVQEMKKHQAWTMVRAYLRTRHPEVVGFKRLLFGLDRTAVIAMINDEETSLRLIDQQMRTVRSDALNFWNVLVAFRDGTLEPPA